MDVLGVRLGAALLLCVSTSCSGGTADRSVPLAARDVVRHASNAATATTAELPHIFAPTLRYGPGSVYNAGIFKFNQEGDTLAFPPIQSTGVRGDLAFDTHDGTLYYLTGYDPATVAAVDQMGDAKPLLGTFGDYNGNDSADSITFDSKNDLLYVQFYNTIEAFDEEGRPHKIAGGTDSPFGCVGVSMLYDAHADAFYRWFDCGEKRRNARAVVETVDAAGQVIAELPKIENAYARIFDITYDANDGLVYVQGLIKGATTHTQISAFTESGDPVALSPGFPADLGAGALAYDGTDATMYVATGRVQSGTTDPGEFVYGSTITAWTDRGVRLPLSGHFDYPRSRIAQFVITQ